MTRMIRTRDPITNFPVAPENHIWALEETDQHLYFGGDVEYRLSLVLVETRRRPIFRWRTREVRTVVTSRDIKTDGFNPLNREQIREAADDLLDHEEQLNWSRKLRKQNEAFLGEYPPKTL